MVYAVDRTTSAMHTYDEITVGTPHAVPVCSSVCPMQSAAVSMHVHNRMQDSVTGKSAVRSRQVLGTTHRTLKHATWCADPPRFGNSG
ncbi:hypothetical protein BaRGS_00013656 [Batillaria attramentaria]|uniref:Uncharacterized protein n=1 Tax=Batillaria attramentaria TaxID=370345 RepID=A0ABD0L6U9_9CAEN